MQASRFRPGGHTYVVSAICGWCFYFLLLSASPWHWSYQLLLGNKIPQDKSKTKGISRIWCFHQHDTIRVLTAKPTAASSKFYNHCRAFNVTMSGWTLCAVSLYQWREGTLHKCQLQFSSLKKLWQLQKTLTEGAWVTAHSKVRKVRLHPEN